MFWNVCNFNFWNEVLSYITWTFFSSFHGHTPLSPVEVWFQVPWINTSDLGYLEIPGPHRQLKFDEWMTCWDGRFKICCLLIFQPRKLGEDLQNLTQRQCGSATHLDNSGVDSGVKQKNFAFIDFLKKTVTVAFRTKKHFVTCVGYLFCAKDLMGFYCGGRFSHFESLRIRAISQPLENRVFALFPWQISWLL